MRDVPPHDLDRLLRETVAAAPGEGCPDPNDLAALAEDRVEGPDRDRLVAHLLGCATCSEVVRALLPAAPPEAVRRPFLRRPLGLVAAAAVLLVGIGAAIRLAGRSDPPSEDTARLLAEAASRLAAAAPEAYAGFRPLAAEDLRTPGSEPLRGGEATASPSGRTLESRPTFRWEPVPGAREYTVALLGPEGVRWTRTTAGTSLEWPAGEAPLEPGSRAVWTLSADDPLGTEVERAIAVPTEEEGRAWADAVRAAESEPAPLRWLLLAHAALRRDLPGPAVLYASRYRDARPGDALGEATLAHALARGSHR